MRNRFLMLAILLVVDSAAEGDTAVIDGVVRDESGGVLPGVTVSAVPDGADGAPRVQVDDAADLDYARRHVYPGIRVPVAS